MLSLLDHGLTTSQVARQQQQGCNRIISAKAVDPLAQVTMVCLIHGLKSLATNSMPQVFVSHMPTLVS